MPNSQAIDSAIVARLKDDATLAALMPGGVWVDEAPGGLTQFVIVSLITERDVASFEGRAAEEALYLIKAVEFSAVTVRQIAAAAARLDALLELAQLTVPGYAVHLVRRAERVRQTEVDAKDSALRWQHRGGRYEVIAAPTS
jgi:hypothetical protein